MPKKLLELILQLKIYIVTTKFFIVYCTKHSKVYLIFFSSVSNFLFIFKLLLIHLKVSVQIFSLEVWAQVVREVQKYVKQLLQNLSFTTNQSLLTAHM